MVGVVVAVVVVVGVVVWVVDVVGVVVVGVVVAEVVGVVTSQSWKPPRTHASVILVSVAATSSHSSTDAVNPDPTHSIVESASQKESADGPQNSFPAAPTAVAVAVHVDELASSSKKLFSTFGKPSSTAQVIVPTKLVGHDFNTLFSKSTCPSQEELPSSTATKRPMPPVLTQSNPPKNSVKVGVVVSVKVAVVVVVGDVVGVVVVGVVVMEVVGVVTSQSPACGKPRGLSR